MRQGAAGGHEPGAVAGGTAAGLYILRARATADGGATAQSVRPVVIVR